MTSDDHRPATRALATIVRSRDDPALRPTAAGVDLLPGGWVVVGAVPGGGEGLLSIASLGLPEETVAFCLDDDERAALAAPLLVSRVIEDGDVDEVLFLGPGCRLVAPLDLDPLPDSTDVEVFPADVRTLDNAAAHPTDLLDAGIGRAAPDLVRLRVTPRTRALVGMWSTLMVDRYVTDPTADLLDNTARLFSALPAVYPWAGWNHQGVYASWEAYDRAQPPSIIGIRGLEEARAGRALPHLTARRIDPVAPNTVPVAPTTAPARLPRFDDGSTPSEAMRAAVRALDPLGARWPKPTDGAGLRAWLETVDGSGLTRYARSVYWARPDLVESFPPGTTTARTLTSWMHRVGIAPTVPAPQDAPGNLALSRILHRVRRKPPTLDAPRATPPSPIGVNIAGYATAATGLGQAMRATVEALERLGHRPAVVDASGEIYAPRTYAPPTRIVGTPFDLTILHLNPDQILHYRSSVLAYRLGAPWVVGAWYWETDRLPRSWLPALDLVDEIWAASEYVAATVRRETTKPVHVTGLPVDPPQANADRARFGIPADRTIFLAMADAFSSATRKNPLLTIRAFRAAFGPAFAGVHLILKISNLAKFPALARQIESAIDGLPATVVDQPLDVQGVWDLHASSDVYVSLHASEGFGLTILEAMALGKTAVVTSHGGNMDFTNDDNSLLVDHDIVDVTADESGIYREGRWAAPRVESAAAQLRAATDPDLRGSIGAAARETATAYTAEAYAHRIGRRLDALGIRPTDTGPQAVEG